MGQHYHQPPNFGDLSDDITKEPILKIIDKTHHHQELWELYDEHMRELAEERADEMNQ